MTQRPGARMTQGAAIVALGGGHGLYATLRALRHLSEDVTAVVTVADDGGSSGRLREELGALPPGDLRMALAALAAPTEHGELWSTTVQHRFGGTGTLAGHAVGNLLITALTEVLGDPVAALDAVGEILGVRGRVLPMSRQPLDIEADVVCLGTDPRVSTAVRGQHAVASTSGQVRRVRLIPSAPPACAEAVAAVLKAELVVLGPGSWFTSVIPHVLVPELLAALTSTSAVRVVVLNLTPEPSETAGFTAERYLHVLSQHASGLRLDAVVVDSRAAQLEKDVVQVSRVAAQLGARLYVADVARPGTDAHDDVLLGKVLTDVLERGRTPEGARVVHEVTEGEDARAWR